jgi:hypothetical protein
MKVRAIQMGDDEMPATVTLEATVDEAAVIYAFVGSIAPAEIANAGGDIRWGNALYDVADCLSGNFFNRFWEDGAKEVAPRLSPSVGGST